MPRKRKTTQRNMRATARSNRFTKRNRTKKTRKRGNKRNKRSKRLIVQFGGPAPPEPPSGGPPTKATLDALQAAKKPKKIQGSSDIGIDLLKKDASTWFNTGIWDELDTRDQVSDKLRAVLKNLPTGTEEWITLLSVVEAPDYKASKLSIPVRALARVLELEDPFHQAQSAEPSKKQEAITDGALAGVSMADAAAALKASKPRKLPKQRPKEVEDEPEWMKKRAPGTGAVAPGTGAVAEGASCPGFKMDLVGDPNKCATCGKLRSEHI
jgi:hypothetical protein